MRSAAASLLARLHAALRLLAVYAALAASGADAVVQPPPTALVIGAGMAGLKAARVLLDAGFIVTVLVWVSIGAFLASSTASPLTALHMHLIRVVPTRRRAAIELAAAFGLTIRSAFHWSSEHPRCVFRLCRVVLDLLLDVSST